MYSASTIWTYFDKPIRFLLIVLMMLISACASVNDDSSSSTPAEALPTQENLPKFSNQNSGATMPTGWTFYRIAPFKKNTVYHLEKYQGRTILSASSKTAASGLAIKLVPRSAQNLWLRWEWKATGMIPAADNADQQNDDAPLRIMVAFDGNKSKLSLKEKMNFELANLISGQEMPYATLMYIWSGKTPVDTTLDNPRTTRVKMIVVDSGQEHIGEWRLHERDLSADYQKAYGEAAGKVIGIALLTDTDNTQSETRAYYGDIELIRK
ncbi:DUF3047 domain-containing protein [Polynucleobacter paneuropaeus]|nr:DUF3047 domain-containing protein [Polynucleobacter paneuropaeus]